MSCGVSLSAGEEIGIRHLLTRIAPSVGQDGISRYTRIEELPELKFRDMKETHVGGVSRNEKS